jgi:hypothetical protein
VADEQEVAKLTKRMDLLDQRLDNIDSMVTAVAERVMSQPIVLLTTCPHCHKNIEVTIIGTGKTVK